MKNLFLVQALILLSLGCGEGTESADPGDAGGDAEGDAGGDAGLTWHEHIRPIVDRRCATCHQPGQIAPFALTDHAQITARLPGIRDSVATDRMPPWPATHPERYISEVPMTPDEKARLLAWIDAGAPEGDPTRAVPSTIPEPRALSRVDLRLSMPTPYQPVGNPDDYRCFLLDWPHDTERFLSGFQAVPGDPSMVHHIALYLVGPTLAARARARQEPDQVGYPCFGGPNISDDPLTPFAILGLWGPGQDPQELPPGMGLRIQPGSVLVLQVHYSLPPDAGTDQTSIELKLETQVEREAAMLPFINLDWVTRQTMTIPAGQDNVRHTHQRDPTTDPTAAIFTNGVLRPGEPFEIFNVNLHMHTRGKSTRTSIRRADGSEVPLLDLPAWDFHWQFGYPLRETVIFHPGDELFLECIWNNSEANQPVVDGVRLPPQDLNWGENTGDEMCAGAYFVARMPAQ
jgi:hypothetical protein